MTRTLRETGRVKHPFSPLRKGRAVVPAPGFCRAQDIEMVDDRRGPGQPATHRGGATWRAPAGAGDQGRGDAANPAAATSAGDQPRGDHLHVRPGRRRLRSVSSRSRRARLMRPSCQVPSCRRSGNRSPPCPAARPASPAPGGLAASRTGHAADRPGSTGKAWVPCSGPGAAGDGAAPRRQAPEARSPAPAPPHGLNRGKARRLRSIRPACETQSGRAGTPPSLPAPCRSTAGPSAG